MKYKTAFRLALRAIGVWVAVSSLPGLMVWGARVAWLASLGTGQPLTPLTQLGFETLNALQYACMLALGLYLFFGGEWIVRLAIPSNRPYCPDCGYDLAGLTRSDRCPECGTLLPNVFREAARHAPIDRGSTTQQGDDA